MELVDVIQTIVQNSMGAAQLTDLKVGTVISPPPALSVQIAPNLPPLPASVLLMTDEVMEKTLSLQDQEVLIDGSPKLLTMEGVVIQPALAVGERVILLRVQSGQKFIVLSRVR